MNTQPTTMRGEIDALLLRDQAAIRQYFHNLQAHGVATGTSATNSIPVIRFRRQETIHAPYLKRRNSKIIQQGLGTCQNMQRISTSSAIMKNQLTGKWCFYVPSMTYHHRRSWNQSIFHFWVILLVALSLYCDRYLHPNRATTLSWEGTRVDLTSVVEMMVEMVRDRYWKEEVDTGRSWWKFSLDRILIFFREIDGGTDKALWKLISVSALLSESVSRQV